MINGNLWSSHLALKANGNKCQWKTDVGGSYRDCFCFLQKINHMLVQSVVQSDSDRRNRRYQPHQALRGIDSFQQEPPDSDKCDFIVWNTKENSSTDYYRWFQLYHYYYQTNKWDSTFAEHFVVGPLKDLCLLAALLLYVIKLPIRGEKWLKFQSIKLIGDVTK